MSNKKKKQNSRFLKVYAIACSISLLAGLFSFIAAKKVSTSVAELNNLPITLPTYEKISQNSGKPKQTPAPSAKPEEEKSVPAYGSESISSVTTTPPGEEKIIFNSPCQGTLLKKFSDDKPLKSKTMGDFRTHNGVDIKCNVGDSVYAVAEGTVEKVYDDSLLGVTVVIAHSDTLKTQYSNIAGKSMVKQGQTLKSNECIGCVGDTAKSELLDDAHLHFSVIENDKYVNPEDYVKILKPNETV